MSDYRGVHLPLTIRDVARAHGAARGGSTRTGARTYEGEGAAEEEGAEDGTVHVFSLASGLLYERMLRIMMASVLERTKRKVITRTLTLTLTLILTLSLTLTPTLTRS